MCAVKCHHGELQTSRVQQCYGLQDGAVPDPGGAGPDAAVLSAAEQMVAGVTAVFDDGVGLLPAPLGGELLLGWQLLPVDVLNGFHHPL